MATRNKLYYPKSHIITNLYTSGNEWMLEDGTEYKGYYHRYIDNTVLTGAVFNSSESKKLIPYVSVASQPENFIYNTLIKQNSFVAPYVSITLPTLDDYNIGKFSRFFLRRRNFSNYQDILEIDKAQFAKWKITSGGIDANIYDAIQLDWKLTGPLYDDYSNKIPVYGVADTNERIVLIKDRTFPGLKNFLTDYIEYSIYSKAVSEDIKKLFGVKE